MRTGTIRDESPPVPSTVAGARSRGPGTGYGNVPAQTSQRFPRVFSPYFFEVFQTDSPLVSGQQEIQCKRH